MPVKNEMDDQKFMCGPDCGSSCPECGGERSKKKKSMMALGYSEDAADAIVTEMFGPEFSEDITPMLVARLRVIVGRCNEILQVLDHAHMSAKMGGGEVEMDRWMVDKITMAADYLSAVADNSKFGGGVKVEADESPYGEKKGLWANIHAKRERIKRGSGERMRRPGEKGAPSAADLKAADKDNKKK